MSRQSMTEFLQHLLASDRFRLEPGGQVSFRKSKWAAWAPLEFTIDPRGKGMMTRIRLYEQLRLVKQRDLVWTLHYLKPPGEAIVPADGDHRNCDPKNLVELTRYVKRWRTHGSASKEPMNIKVKKADFLQLVFIRDRYWPDPIPSEVLEAYPANPVHLRQRLKEVPVRPLTDPGHRLHYIPDTRPGWMKTLGQGIEPVKDLPEVFGVPPKRR